uniref:Catechol oxidase n=1 Tax=Chenopodium quinoa TaxID=63459 RepID=A0A803L763_CHEQI
MAASLYSLTIITSTIPLNPNSLFSKTLLPPIARNRTRMYGCTPKILCKVAKNDDFDHQSPKTTNNIDDINNIMLDRRNILVGLGSLCGATTTTFTSGSTTLAAPIAMDVTNCDVTGDECCPPIPINILDFKPPDNQKLRLRPAAHLVDNEYLDKYSKAISLMKKLPEDDPRSFIQQANVHCAYCKLIDDPSFALPFWNWDHPDGMYMPSLYTNPTSTLYDPFRNASHLPPTLMDLSHDGDDNNELTPKELITSNLAVMHRQMVSNAKNPTLFFGRAYRAGDELPIGAGTIETMPHNIVHNWTGDPTQPNGEDMGIFNAAARDSIFYAHHANVDRMWVLWKTLGGKRKDIEDPDWLNVSFLFYDENAQPVRIKVRDCLDHKKLGYIYQDVDISPWLNLRPNSSKNKQDKLLSVTKRREDSTSGITLPRILDSTIRTRDKFIKFDVYINEKDDLPKRKSRMNAEYAGCFASLPHKQHKTKDHNKKTCLTIGLTDLIEDQAVDGDDSIDVILVPRAGSDAVVITDDLESEDGRDGVNYSVKIVTNTLFPTFDDAVKWADAVSVNLGFILVKSSYNKTRDGRPYQYLKCDWGRKSKPKDLENAIQKDKKTKANACPFYTKTYYEFTTSGWKIRAKNDKIGTHNYPMIVYQEGHRKISGLSPGAKKVVRDITKSMVAPRNIMATIAKQFPDDHPNIIHIYNCWNDLRTEMSEGIGLFSNFFIWRDKVSIFTWSWPMNSTFYNMHLWCTQSR